MASSAKYVRRKSVDSILKDGGGEVQFYKHALKGIPFKGLEDGQEAVFEGEPGRKGLHATFAQHTSRCNYNGCKGAPYSNL